MKTQTESLSSPGEPSEGNSLEDKILAEFIPALRKLDQASRRKILQTLSTYFEVDVKKSEMTTPKVAPSTDSFFTEERSLAPKEFMLEKAPHTDRERIACLAYYLTHYRDTPEFKTVDLSKLNTEAAQLKLSNPTVAVDNATKAGFLIPTSRGNKSISAIGERYVLALPDRDAARAVLAKVKPRRRKKKVGPKPKDQ